MDVFRPSWPLFRGGLGRRIPTVQKPKTSTYTDDFPGSSLNAAYDYSALATVTGGELNLALDGVDGTYAYAGVGPFTLHESSMSVKITDFGPALLGAATEVYFSFFYESGNGIYITYWNGHLQAVKTVNGTPSGFFDSALSSTVCPYWRMSETGGTVTFEYSADGTSWTTMATTATSGLPSIRGGFMEMGAGHFAAGQSAGTVKFDKLNILGAAYTQTNTGAITPAGALVKTAKPVYSGTITPAGALIKKALKTLAGTITPAGALVKKTLKTMAGTITPSGALTLLRTQSLSTAGTITPTGALTKLARKVFAGTITPAGNLVKLPLKVFSGTITPAGVAVKRVNKTMGGTVTPTGDLTLVQSTSPLFPRYTGTITPTGALRLKVLKTFSGSITPTGRLCKQWPFPTWTTQADVSLTLTAVTDASLSLSSVTDASLSLSAVNDASLTLTGVNDTTLTPTVVTEECS